MVFITSPNNPTGQAIPLDQLRALIAVTPGIVVIDEAYAEFNEHASTLVLLEEFADKLGGHPDHEQGVRVRRRPAGLPGRRAGAGGRVAVVRLPITCRR